MSDNLVKKLNKDPNLLSKMLQGLEQLRVGNKSNLKQSQSEALFGGNKVLVDLNKYLFSFSTLLIPIIFSFASINEIRNNLTQIDSVLIKLSLLFLISSLVAGFLHMITDYNFFKKWRKAKDKQLKLWSNISFWPSVPLPAKVSELLEEYDSIREDVDNIEEDTEVESSLTYLILQGVFWFIGILLLVAVIFRVLP